MEQLQRNLTHKNVQAFLRVIRYCEGTADPDGYRRIFGGSHFHSFADHPRKVIKARLRKGGTLSSSAAGAYQHLSKTWDAQVKQLGFTDFSPESQDLAAIDLIRGRNALADVRAGRLEVAIHKCAKEWASFPGSPYGQPTKSMAECKRIYELHGGSYGPINAPVRAV